MHKIRKGRGAIHRARGFRSVRGRERKLEDPLHEPRIG
jgi:hypothetical protein